MRALCGAIITAGAMLALGLVSVAIGLRYQGYGYVDMEGNARWVRFGHIDTALLIALLTSLLVLLIGLGIAFVGLAYHHHRRHLESLHHHNRGTERTQERMTL